MKTLRRAGFWLFIGGLVFALWPVAAVLVATGLTAITGCDVNEGGVQACNLLGLDIGELLYTLFVSGWYALVTLPIGGIAAFVGLIVYIVARVAGRSSKEVGTV